MIKEVIFDTIKRRGFMLVLSSPSGAGKTTLAKEVLVHEKALELSISVTTRPKRESEKEGLDYYFVDEETFTQMVDEKQLLEHAYVYGYHYGTPKASIEKLLAAGTDVLFDIDWQGTQQLKQISMNDLVSVFLLPPTVKTLETRLRNRGEDSDETVCIRMDKAADEISHWAEYDYIIINQNLSESIQAVRSILQAERLKRRRQVGLAPFVNSLRGES
ncbi:MAG: guanylate kinase [Alphaproteobacteria bacterium]|jgi:guanylate kinase|nr:guanylate kinase [Alphaproteobacteria bacterium]MBP7729610.1 guanylate kinase [Alphaproteobacteria bacterium]